LCTSFRRQINIQFLSERLGPFVQRRQRWIQHLAIFQAGKRTSILPLDRRRALDSAPTSADNPFAARLSSGLDALGDWRVSLFGVTPRQRLTWDVSARDRACATAQIGSRIT